MQLQPAIFGLVGLIGRTMRKGKRAVIALIVVKTWIETIIVLTGIVNYKAYSNRMIKSLLDDAVDTPEL